MLLVAGPAPEFLKFLQVLCWIVIPVFIAAIAITFFLHYRKKKKETGEEAETEEKLLESVSGLVGYTNGNGEYILFDNSVLIQEYKNSLSYNHARYTALQHDFTKMEKKYAALALYARNLFIKPKKQIMGNAHEQMPRHVEADINRLAEGHATEKKELQDKVAQLERSCRQMEQENKALQEQINTGTGTDDEKAVLINKWKEENIILRDKVAEQEYLQDVVEEKKAQVIFLQNQLEQRIKNLYQSEHERLKAVNEMKQTRAEMDTLKNELLFKQEQADKIQVVLCEKEEQLTERHQLLTNKLEHITQLENMLRETKEQNEFLTASVGDSRGRISTLEQQLSEEQSKVQFLTQKLFVNKQTIRRLHKEFSSFVDDEGEESPVIPLRPEYSNKENEGIAMQ